MGKCRGCRSESEGIPKKITADDFSVGLFDFDSGVIVCGGSSHNTPNPGAHVEPGQLYVIARPMGR